MSGVDTDQRTLGVVVLIGLMGSGKSTVGMRLAQQLNCEFVDVDARIALETNKTVREIFASDGEEEFRKVESSVLATVLNESLSQISDRSATCVIIATGGGAIIAKSNRDKMIDSADHIIWLQADVDALVRRTSASKSVRPLLDSDPRNTLQALDRERSDLYGQIATTKINTSALRVDQVVDQIVTVVQSTESK